MKKLLVIIFVFTLVLVGCANEAPAELPETPSESSEETLKPIPEEQPESSSEAESEPESEAESEFAEILQNHGSKLEVKIPEGEEKNATDLYLESKTDCELSDEFVIYATGKFLHNTWEDPYFFSPDDYAFFFEYYGMDDEFFDMLNREYRDKGIEVPTVYEFSEDEVENFILSCYNVDSSFLRKAKNYDAEKKTYAFSTEHGFGGGPAPCPVKIVRLEDNIYMFYLESFVEMEGEEPYRYELKIEIKEDLSYKYLSNKYIPSKDGEG